MATKTLGSIGTTTLTAVQWPSRYAGTAVSDADLATIAQSILDDAVPDQSLSTARSLVDRIVPGAFTRAGQLYIPNRGVLKVLPGDWVGVDLTGWPILLSAKSLAGTLTATGDTHTSTAVNNLSTNVLALGWAAGMRIVATTNADIPAGTRISAIAADGLSLTLSAAATGTNAGGTLTVGDWTHS